MTAQTTKIRNGNLVLPKEIQRIWREAQVTVRIDKDKLIIEKTPVKPADARQQWQKAAGILKGRRIPDPAKWQQEVRKEWERKLP